MTHSKTLHRKTRVYTGQSIDQTDGHPFVIALGYQRTKTDGTTDRWVDVTIRGRGLVGPWVVASASISPDEARSFANLLLDAADEADEQEMA